jgi:histidinol-phosphate aminotransferase
VASLPKYVPGTSAVRADGTPSYKLASKESPNPLPEVLVGAMLEAARQANRYPASGAAVLDRLAQFYRLPAEKLAIGEGSLGLLRDLLTSYPGHGTEVVFGWRSYETYPILVPSTGARSVPVPLVNYRLDLERWRPRSSPSRAWCCW